MKMSYRTRETTSRRTGEGDMVVVRKEEANLVKRKSAGLEGLSDETGSDLVWPGGRTERMFYFPMRPIYTAAGIIFEVHTLPSCLALKNPLESRDTIRCTPNSKETTLKQNTAV